MTRPGPQPQAIEPPEVFCARGVRWLHERRTRGSDADGSTTMLDLLEACQHYAWTEAAFLRELERIEHKSGPLGHCARLLRRAWVERDLRWLEDAG